ncbi:hypothetical protein VTL71DRAFT_2900 [Oculimacula yallundae]|uniref:Uncharacterized protein n=1 Tax=Oculimacula yallundae TaxID=86028 RepID=A0ABR4C5M7_9HELO
MNHVAIQLRRSFGFDPSTTLLCPCTEFQRRSHLRQKCSSRRNRLLRSKAQSADSHWLSVSISPNVVPQISHYTIETRAYNIVWRIKIKPTTFLIVLDMWRIVKILQLAFLAANKAARQVFKD